MVLALGCGEEAPAPAPQEPAAPAAQAEPAAQAAPEGRSEGGGSPKLHADPNAPVLSTPDGRPLAVALPVPADPSLGLTPYEVPQPFYMEAMPVPADNPLTHAGVDLGRRLFYDPLLSGDDTVACATCHHQERSFADRRGASTGASGKPLARNASALVNLAWSAPYFWDGRAPTLEALVPQPIQHPDEMNEDMDRLIAQLQAHPDYPARFEAAFPGQPISEGGIAKAISQFLRTLVSFNSRADLIDTQRVELTELEMRGNQIMTGGLPIGSPDRVPDICDACHKHSSGVQQEASHMGLFTTAAGRSNGLPDVDADGGMGDLSGKPEDVGRFIVPTIRNASVTAPYMHDGRFADLEAVLVHYNEQMVATAATDEPLVKGGAPLRMNMTAEDREAVAAMIGVFTDEHFLENPAFSDPFAEQR